MTQNPSTDLVRIEAGQDLLASAKQVSLEQLLKAVAPTPAEADLPVKLPAAREITEAQRAAMQRVPEVFGKVVPTERRALTDVEVDALIDERQTLDQVKKMVEARIKDITTTAHNHLDVLVEQQIEDPAERPERNKDGHYIVEGRTGVPGRDVEFSREVSHFAPTLNVAALEALDTGEPDALLTHKEFLAMTRPTRVVDENLVMLALRKNPALVKALAAATNPGSKSVSMYLRKRA